MKAKFFKKAVSVVLAVVMLTVLCIPSAFAATADDSADYAPGEVLVSTNFRSESFVRQMLKDFELESVRLIMSTDEGLCYHVIFTEKTTEIVWKAIEVLKADSDIRYAEPNYYMSLPVEPEEPEQPVTEPATEPATAPDEPVTEPPVEETTEPGGTEPDFIPGSVIVSLNSGSESLVYTLLADFEIESVRLITPGSKTQNVYLVKFTEKTEQIVWDAIAVLNESPYVKIAEPDYYLSLPVEPEEPEQPVTEPATESATAPDEPVTEPPVEETTEPGGTEPKFVPGEVLVSTNFRSESFVRELLKSFELESVRLIMSTDEGLCYRVIFTEKTTKIVWEAIDVLTNSADIRCAEPNYYLHLAEEPEEPEEPTDPGENNPVKGDVDGDGKLSIKDASCIQLHLADLMTLDGEQVAAADADGDGKVSIKDAAYIQLQLAGLL